MPKWTIMPGSTQFNTGGNYQYLTLSILLIFKLIDHYSDTEPKKGAYRPPSFTRLSAPPLRLSIPPPAATGT